LGAGGGHPNGFSPLARGFDPLVMQEPVCFPENVSLPASQGLCGLQLSAHSRLPDPPRSPEWLPAVQYPCCEWVGRVREGQMRRQKSVKLSRKSSGLTFWLVTRMERGMKKPFVLYSTSSAASQTANTAAKGEFSSIAHCKSTSFFLIVYRHVPLPWYIGGTSFPAAVADPLILQTTTPLIEERT